MNAIKFNGEFITAVNEETFFQRGTDYDEGINGVLIDITAPNKTRDDFVLDVINGDFPSKAYHIDRMATKYVQSYPYSLAPNSLAHAFFIDMFGEIRQLFDIDSNNYITSARETAMWIQQYINEQRQIPGEALRQLDRYLKEMLDPKNPMIDDDFIEQKSNIFNSSNRKDYEKAVITGVASYFKKNGSASTIEQCYKKIAEITDHKYDEFIDQVKKTSEPLDLMNNISLTYKQYWVKNKERQLKLIGQYRNELCTAAGISPIACRCMLNRMPASRKFTKEDLPELKLLDKIVREFTNTEWHSEDSWYQLKPKDVEKLSRMRNIERELLLNSGFQNDELICIIRNMIPEVNGVPRFTVDYNNYLHSLRGLNLKVGNPAFPGRTECLAYRYPKLRQMLKDCSAYMILQSNIIPENLNAVEAILENGFKPNQMRAALSEYNDAMSFVRETILKEAKTIIDSIKNEMIAEFEKNGIDVSNSMTRYFLTDYAERWAIYHNDRGFVDSDNNRFLGFVLKEDNTEEARYINDDKFKKIMDELAIKTGITSQIKNCRKLIDIASDDFDHDKSHAIPSKEILKHIKHNMYLHATKQYDKKENIAELIIKEVKDGTYVPYQREKQNEVEKMFQDKYHFIPRCTPQIKEMVDFNQMSAADAVNRFDRNKVSEIAGLFNPALVRLTYDMDTSILTRRQKEALECYLTPQDVKGLIELKDMFLSEEAKDWSNEKLKYFIQGASYISKNQELKEAFNGEFTKEVKEKLNGILDYVRAKEDIEFFEKKYGYKFADNTIEIKGKNICIEGNGLTARILAADDPKNFLVGHDTGCCMKPNEPGEDCVYYATSHPDSAIWVIEEKGKIVAQSFIWEDKNSDTLVFDNIEFANDRDTSKYTDILQRYTENMPYANIHMGVSNNHKMQHSVQEHNAQNTQLQKDECCKVPVYTLDKNSNVRVYTDYHFNASVLKRDGQVQFIANTPDLYQVTGTAKITEAIHDQKLNERNEIQSEIQYKTERENQTQQKMEQTIAENEHQKELEAKALEEARESEELAKQTETENENDTDEIDEKQLTDIIKKIGDYMSLKKQYDEKPLGMPDEQKNIMKGLKGVIKGIMILHSVNVRTQILKEATERLSLSDKQSFSLTKQFNAEKTHAHAEHAR